MKYWILAITSVLFGLLLGEGMLRVIPNSYGLRIQRDRYVKERSVMQTLFCETDPDPQIGYRNKPSIEGTFENREFKTRVRFNALGLRGPEVLTKKPVRRMLFLGDSMTVGWGVEDDETFVAQLAKRDASWEVLNAGVSGYATPSEYGLLKRLGSRLHPDEVILVFYPNDPIESNFPATLNPSVPRSKKTFAPFIVDVVRLAMETQKDDGLSYPYYYGFNAAMWKTCTNVLDAITKWCKSRRIKFRMVYMPLKDELGEPNPVGYHKKFLDYCAASTIPCLDLSPVLQRHAVEQTHFVIDEHLTPTGHAVVADALAAWLKL